MCHFNVKGVQINAFVQITELSDKIDYLAIASYNIHNALTYTKSVSWAANSITRANVFVSTVL